MLEPLEFLVLPFYSQKKHSISKPFATVLVAISRHILAVWKVVVTQKPIGHCLASTHGLQHMHIRDLILEFRADSITKDFLIFTGDYIV